MKLGLFVAVGAASRCGEVSARSLYRRVRWFGSGVLILLSGVRANNSACYLRALSAGLSIFIISVSFQVLRADGALAKGPGVRYCFHTTCHRVLTLQQTRARVGKSEFLMSSYYDDCRKDAYNPCGLTSSGERFSPGRHDNVASPIYPDGTVLLLWNPVTKKSAVVRVNNAGPYWGNRKLDVSRAVAEKLGFAGRGVAKLKVEVIRAPNRAEATYVKNRRYAPVAGYIGKFGTFDQARMATAAVVAVEALAASTLALPVGAAVSVARTDKVQDRWKALAKLPEKIKVARRNRLIAAAERGRATRIARVSESPVRVANTTSPTGGSAVTTAVAFVPSLSKALPKSSDAVAETALPVNRHQFVVAIPAAKATTARNAITLAVVGRRGTISRTETTDNRFAVGAISAGIDRRTVLAARSRAFVAIKTNIRRLETSDLFQLATGDAARRVLASRDLFSLQTHAALEVLARKREWDAEHQSPGPQRDLPELPKKIARADARGEFHTG